MLMKFLKYLEEYNIIFLKYDGLRSNNIYTIRVYEKLVNRYRNNFGKDTNNPRCLLESILKETECLCTTYIMENLYDKFMEINEIIKDKFGNDLVIALQCIYSDGDIKYILYVSRDTSSILRIENNQLIDILNELNKEN